LAAQQSSVSKSTVKAFNTWPRNTNRS